MFEGKKVVPEWMESIPVLYAYVKAVIAGQGNKLFQNIVLEGNPKNFSRCAADISDFIRSSGLTESVLINPAKEDRLGSFCIFDSKENAPTRSITCDISKVVFEDPRIKQLQEELPFEVSYEDLKISLALYPQWVHFDIPTIINHTLLTHYQNASDNVLRPEDFTWIETVSIPKKTEEKIETAPQAKEPVDPELLFRVEPKVVVPADTEPPFVEAVNKPKEESVVTPETK